jgi:hypothetical protein
MRSIKMFKTINGEMVLTAVNDITEDGFYVLEYPASVIQVPPQQAGGMQNQVGFGKYLPFSDYDKEILLNPECIAIESEPNAHMLQTYEQWVTQVKAQESGIVTAQGMPQRAPAEVMKDGKAVDFSKLNM